MPARAIFRNAVRGANTDFAQISLVSGDYVSNFSWALKAQALSSTDMTGNGGLISRFQQAQQLMNGAHGVNIPWAPHLSTMPFPGRLQCPPAAFGLCEMVRVTAHTNESLVVPSIGVLALSTMRFSHPMK